MFVILMVLLQMVNSEDYQCYDYKFQPRVCLPGPENILLKRAIKVSPNKTCGEPSSNYCRTAKPSGCYVCNTTNKHPSSFMRDKDYPISYWNFGFKPTWWQSITWWDARERNLLTNDTLKVQLVVSMNKTYDLTGKIKITFYSSKPHALIIEKSIDFGSTWVPYRFYADNCLLRFKDIMLFKDITSFTDIYCEEDQNINAVQGQEIIFQPSYTLNTFWSNGTQDYLHATDFRISLEYPWTDGNEIINQQSFLNKYYYDITDIQIHARCHCSGHAPNCYGAYQKCACQHFTDGIDCEKCLPLYNNKAWKPAEASDKPNPCEECECNDHSMSCTYNKDLNHGVCDGCLHGTAGYFCEQCDTLFYRNISAPINNINRCISCKCFLPGTTGNGSCTKTSNGEAQCYCKANIKGSKCDSCLEEHYGLATSGNCQACNCSIYGSYNSSKDCDQTTGQCGCKSSTGGRTCSHCIAGYYQFPDSVTSECLLCNCDVGGSYNLTCNIITGACLCRHGINGTNCNIVNQDFFLPFVDYNIIEAESNMNEQEVIVLKESYTGLGVVALKPDSEIKLLFTPNVTYRYHAIIRYFLNESHFQNISLKLIYNNATTTYTISDSTIQLNNNHTFYTLNSTLYMLKSINYSIVIKNLGEQKVYIDSVAFLPTYTAVNVYKLSNSTQQAKVSQCWMQHQSAGERILSEEDENIMFSLSAEIFNGALDCECDMNGAKNSSCNPIGGQCYCKIGVTGRQCNQCQLGYFNLTDGGCQACSCDSVGSINNICSRTTGQCVCKTNIINRTCNKCLPDYFGFEKIEGCSPCSCNQQGALKPQCFNNGTCVCKNSTGGMKCDLCKENYFNFTSTGCSTCDCNVDGSQSLQCDSNTGQCPCKQNVIGVKCMECQSGFFNLAKSNDMGCQECFCFNKTNSCLATNRTKVELTITSSSTTFIKINFDEKRKTVVLSSSTSYHGNLLYLHYDNIYLNVLFHLGNKIEVDNYVKLILTGYNNKTLTFQSQPISTNRNLTIVFNIQQKNLVNELSVWELQSVLFNVKKFDMVFVGNNADYAILYSNHVTNIVEEGSYVERCECGSNYTGLSCQHCAQGFTREISDSDSFGKCVKCECNDRSTKCHPETGVCSACRYGTSGKFCEKCSPNVLEPGCSKCKTGFYGFNITSFVGCKACDCISPNTVTLNQTICNEITGQCPCKPDIGGRVCDRCAENAVNSTIGCKTCSPCHGLIQDEVHNLRESIKNFKSIVRDASSVRRVVSAVDLPSTLQDLTLSTTKLFNNAVSSSSLEKVLMKDLLSVNETLDELLLLLQVNISNSVNVLREKLPELNSTTNTSSVLIDTIYRFLWTSVYILNTEIEPKNISLSQKNYMLNTILNNVEEVGRKYESIYAPVLNNMALLLNTTVDLMNQSSFVNNQAKDIETNLNITSKTLFDVGNAIKGTDTLMTQLHTDASTFFNLTRNLVRDINLTLNITSRKNSTVLNSAIPMKTKLSSLESELKSINESFEETLKSHEKVLLSAQVYMNSSTALRSLVNVKLLLNNDTYEQIYSAKSNVSLHLQKVLDINSTASRMVEVLANFQSTAVNASVHSKQALEYVRQMNVSSATSLQRLLTTQSIIDSMKLNISSAYNTTMKVYNQTQLNSKVLDDLLISVKDLLNASNVLLSEASKQQNITENITNISKTVRKQHSYCQNTSRGIYTAADQLNDLKVNASEASWKENATNIRLKELINDISNVTVFNTTKLFNLKDNLNKSRDLFDSVNIKNVLADLRKTRDSQAGFLLDYRTQVDLIKEDVYAMRMLYESLNSKKGCDE